MLAGSMALQAQDSTKVYNQKKYNKQLRKVEKKLEKEVKKQKYLFGNAVEAESEATPDAYWVQQFLATLDPALNRPTPEVLLPILQNLYKPGLSNRAAAGKTSTPWVERGPNNVGGRTRALAWDPSDVTGKKVWAGGVSGGLWVNNDITSNASKWVPVQSLWSNLSVTAIAFGSLGKDTIYVGTGEGYGASSSMTRGFGIWKSTDGGKTFALLNSTTNFFYCTDIVVRTENGKSVIYASIVPNYYGATWHGASSGQFGIFRSLNGGTSWTNVSGTAANGGRYCFGDLEIAADNRIWAGSMKNPNGGADAGGGRVMYSDNGTTWTTAFRGEDGRVEVACAPNGTNRVYAMLESGGKLDSIVMTSNRGSSWTARNEPDDQDLGIPASDFTRGQAWYDLIMAVDPNDSATLIVGGVDLFRSTNSANSWTHISKWSNNSNLNTLSCPLVHADQHAIVYKPGSSSTVIFGNDGGVYYTSSVSSASSSSSAIVERNNGYNVTQFYWGDLSQTSGSNVMIAGAQDNGTQRFTTAGVNSTSEVTGGDGAYCFISPSNSSKQISSYVYNTYYYTTNSWGSTNTLLSRPSLGRFINPAIWDDAGPGLISYRSAGRIYRQKLNTTPGALDSVYYKTGASDLGSAFYIHTTKAGKSRLWVGTDAGNIYRTHDAWATSPTFTSQNSGVNAGNISGFNAIRTGDTIAVVLSNYGINNVYISKDSGTTWTAKDGNLPNMPVWSIVLNPDKIGEAVIATELGIYGTSNIFATSPIWTADTAGIGPVKVSTLRYRKADKMLMAVTHGRGVFTNDAWAKNNPITLFGASATNVCTNTTVTLLDSSLNDPTQWAWSITPKNISYVGGTDSTAKNPQLRFTAGGTYSIKLTATNALGNSSLTRSSFITVTDTIIGTATLGSARSSVCAGDTTLLTVNLPAALNGTITAWNWFKNTGSFSTVANAVTVTPNANDSFYAVLTSNKKCVSPATFNTNKVRPTVNSLVNAKAITSASAGCANKPLNVNVSGTNTGASPVWSWYVDGTLQSGNTGTLTIATPVNGSKVWATVNVAGPCVRPANLIKSDTQTLVVNPKPATPVVSRNFDTLFATNVGSGTYTWYRSGVVKGTGRSLKVNQNGTYKCVYAENGCQGDSSTAIVFNTLLADPLQLNGIYLAPIPANNVLNVYGANQAHSFRVYSATGALVLDAPEVEIKAGLVQIQISALKPGTYLLEFVQNSQKLTARFVKQ